MMNINRYHICFWLFFSSFFIILDYLQFEEYFSIVRELYMVFVQLSIFYSFLFALVQFKVGSLWYWIKSVGFFVLSFGFILFLNYWRGKLATHYDIVMHESFGKLLNDTIRIYSGLAFYSLGYYYLTRYGTKQKELKEMVERQAATELSKAKLALHNAELAAHNAGLREELLEVENNFLRAQVNPHFLYNTLNLFYAKALPNNKDLANGILTLADIMRYSLEATISGQLVPLHMEVAQLQRLIEIHQIRFSNKLNIKFDVTGSCDTVSIAPLIFITLLENALKHGELNDPDDPIMIELSIDDSHIYFAIRNKKSTDPPENSHGIGLENVKKRLSNVYGSHYRFTIKETDTEYYVALSIERNYDSWDEN